MDTKAVDLASIESEETLIDTLSYHTDYLHLVKNWCLRR